MDNVRILKSQVTKTTYQAVLVAVFSIIIATIMLSVFYTGTVSAEGIIKAQTENYAVWILDTLPIVFGFWGQYASSIMAYQAGAMVLDQTQELRSLAETLEKQANYQATHDQVTDLPNRALFYDRVERAIFAANRSDKFLSVLLVEVANIKEVHDTLGRSSSDLLLKQIATRLQGVVLGQDSVARIDNNTFSILLLDTDNDDEAVEMAKYIQAALEPVFVVDRTTVGAHCNIGIVNFPEHGDDVDTLVQKAGVALFIAGQSHQGYAIYQPSFDDRSPRRLTLMSELRQAIEKNQLRLHYQPKVSVANGVLYGAESLVRWQHPKHGFISPDEFIPMAERTRMIKHLTIWVLKEAFKHCAEWHKRGLGLTISVNLSAKDLHDPELVDVIAGIAAATAINPDWIILEITESSIMTDPEISLATIKRLRNMGYRFSIDDFGTGYSSLAYLRKLPLSELKIDKSFVMDLLDSEASDAVIVNAIINLAHNLDLQVTAEGVENSAILERLGEFGCDIAQGYHFSKPLSYEDFNQWLSNAPWQLKSTG